MKKGVLKNLFFMIGTLMLIFCIFPAKVKATAAEDFLYEEKNGEITITGLKKYEVKDLIIPSEINGKPVKTIGNDAFGGGRIDLTGKLVIPDSVTTIGNRAFSNCEGLTGELIIPDSVTTIGGSAFIYCKGFTSLTLGNNVTAIWEDAFASCSGLTGELKIPDSLTIIGSRAFESCSGLNGELKIPDNVTKISDYAFYGCKGFTSLTLGKSIDTIGMAAFLSCSGLKGDLIIPDSVTTIGDCAFEWEDFSGLTIGKSVTTIGYRAFFGCSKLKGELIIPESVTSIGKAAFYDCSGFTSLTIGSNVTTIGEEAFLSCYGITGELIIPDSVTTVGDRAFENCFGFPSISVPFPNQACMDAEPGWGKDIFSDCTDNIIFRGEYEISFDKNNAAATGSMKNLYTKGHILTLPVCEFTAPDGYVFAGWSRNASGTGITEKTITIDGNSKNVTIYALWKKNTRPLIEKFTERMYTKALDRSAEPEGLKYWADRLEQQVDDGANVAYGFITSTEFIARNLSDDEFLETMYQTFFDRASDSVGKTYWMDKLNSGASREMVLAGFVVSEEFGNLCSEAEIERGLILEDGTPVNAGIYQFVKRQYTCCLQRDGERAGMDYWATKIAKREVSAVDTAKEFFFSAEFEGKGLSDKQFVERLYETFLGRPFDEVGYAYWNDKMSKGETRREVIDEFAASEEFKGILRSYGL